MAKNAGLSHPLNAELVDFRAIMRSRVVPFEPHRRPSAVGVTQPQLSAGPVIRLEGA